MIGSCRKRRIDGKLSEARSIRNYLCVCASPQRPRGRQRTQARASGATPRCAGGRTGWWPAPRPRWWVPWALPAPATHQPQPRVVYLIPTHLNFRISVGATWNADLLEIEGLFTQGSRPSRTVGEPVAGILITDSSDRSDGNYFDTHSTRPNTEFKPSRPKITRVSRNHQESQNE